MEENLNSGVTERVDSVDASKILGTTSEGSAKSTGRSSAGVKSSETSADSYSTLALIFGVLSVVGGFSGIVSLAFGIVGLIMADKAKRLGLDDTMRKVGFWTSLAGVIMSGISLLLILFIIAIWGLGFFGTILAIIAGGAIAAKGLIILL